MTSTLDPTTAAQPGGRGEGASRPSLAERGRRAARRISAPRAVRLVALVPPLAMLLVVLHSSKLQWFDYWTIFPRITNPDGSLAPRRLFSYHEGHVLAVPGVVYWLNYKLTSGLNTALGLFVLAIVAAQAVMLRVLLPRAKAIGQWQVTSLVIAISALMFASQGAHNFSRAMSGTAWLLANLFAVVAILAICRGRLWWAAPVAVGAGVLASLSYGTGLMTWPALLVALVVIRRRVGVPHAVAVAAGATVLGAYFLHYDRPASQSAVGFDLVDVGRRVAQVLGSALVPDPMGSMVAGVVAIVAAGFLLAAGWRADARTAAPWMAIVVYAVLGAVMIGFARGGVAGDDIGTASRYYSLSALCWCGLVVLAVWLRPRDLRIAGVSLVVAGLAFVAGQPTVETMRRSALQQDELAIAMRLGVSQNYPFFYGSDRFRPMLERLGHYPYSGHFDADCGRLGDTLGAGGLVTDLDAVGARGHLDKFAAAYSPSQARLQGWIDSPRDPVRCVLVVDGQGTVIGAGAYGIQRPDLVAAGGSQSGNYDVGFIGVAPSGATSYAVVAQLADGKLVRLPETLGRSGLRTG